MWGSGFWSSRLKNKGSQTSVDADHPRTQLAFSMTCHMSLNPAAIHSTCSSRWREMLQPSAQSYTHATSRWLLLHFYYRYCTNMILGRIQLGYFIARPHRPSKQESSTVLLYCIVGYVTVHNRPWSRESDRWKKAATIELTRTFVWSVDGLCS